MFLLLEEKEKGKKNDNWNFWICYLSKNGRFVTHICFSKNALLKPLFLLCFLGARFLAKLSKKGNSGHPPKTKENFDWLLKSSFLGFCVFFIYISFSFVWGGCFLCLFFGGFKGQVRWPEGPLHLALNPPYLFLFFGGFSKPSLFIFGLFCFCVLFSFPFFDSNRKNLFSS